ncbi:MAG: glutamate dehydrogenase, partial [Paramuribaculum sp.]|nr:glutamate dehydrogenase [Paramuribaculum sp.]
TAEEVDRQLRRIMSDIHAQCERYGRVDDEYINYVKGANTAGFMKVARAMMAQGIL